MKLFYPLSYILLPFFVELSFTISVLVAANAGKF
jgi:hypothetical protein